MMEIVYKDSFDDSWLEQILELHNKTELKRNSETNEFFLSAYKNRYAIISAWLNDQLIGFGTMISDGYMYSALFDVVVDPAFQKKGIGKEIVSRLLSKAPTTCVHLTSTFGNEEFYTKLGFKKHKTAMAKYPWSSEYLES